MTSSPPKFYILAASTPTELLSTKELFTAYTDALGLDLSFQNFAAELASLPGLYAPPAGAIFLAYSNSSTSTSPCTCTSSPSPSPSPVKKPIGVVALRPLPLPLPSPLPAYKVCEMKRLYCAPGSRGLGVGRALVNAVVAEAGRLGYAEMRLDTLREMGAARRLYGELGFVEMEPYYQTPIEGTVFLVKRLGDGGELRRAEES